MDDERAIFITCQIRHPRISAKRIRMEYSDGKIEPSHHQGCIDCFGLAACHRRVRRPELTGGKKFVTLPGRDASNIRSESQPRNPNGGMSHPRTDPPGTSEIAARNSFMHENPAETTEQLLHRVQDGGDEEAADELVRRLYPVVWMSVRRHIRNHSDHEDVAQEIFMKIFMKIGQYKGIQPLEHWVSRVAVTTCYDWLRKKRARPLAPFADFSEHEIGLIEAAAGKMAVDETDDLRMDLLGGLLDRLVDGLKPREQIVVRLMDLERRSVLEISELTGWSASKIKTTAMRARRKLAERLQKLESRGTFSTNPPN